ncbi:MAG: hypothetical protein HUK20_11970 [Fibrobacter sp.]|nr:hypothetical protein [Fibrobacter sp.]
MSDTKQKCFKYLGMEAGATSIKVAYVDAANRRVLRTAVLETQTSPLDDIYTLEENFQKWMDENEIKEFDAVSITVPAFRSVIRQVFVPPEASKNLDDYLQWYITTITNAKPGDYLLTFQIMSGDERLGYTVMLIAARREWVDNVRKGFRNKDLAPKAFDVDVLSLMNLLDYAEKVTELECVVKADYAGVILMWMVKDSLQALRCISTLDLSNKSTEEAYQILAGKIKNQIRLAQEENAAIVTKNVRLCGDMAVDISFVETLRKNLDGCQLSLMDSFSNMRLPVEAEDSAVVLSCSAAIGAALNVMEGV